MSALTPDPPPLGQEPAERSSKRWFRGTATDWIAVVLSAAAVVTAVASWRQSQQAQKSAEDAEHRENARKVTWVKFTGENPQRMTIINRNSFDLKEVTIVFNDGYFLRPNYIPGCSTWTLTDFGVPNTTGGTYTLTFPARLDFTDAVDPPGRWTIQGENPVRPQKSRPSLPAEKDLTAAYSKHINVGDVPCN
jgi:hypothetical protein